MNKNELLTQLKEIKAELVQETSYQKTFIIGATDFLNTNRRFAYLDFIDEIKESDIKGVFVYENNDIYRAYIEIEA